MYKRQYLNRDEKPLIIFDGGTGTSFQNLNLNADDFGGKELEGCNENLVLSSPNVVEKVFIIHSWKQVVML